MAAGATLGLEPTCRIAVVRGAASELQATASGRRRPTTSRAPQRHDLRIVSCRQGGRSGPQQHNLNPWMSNQVMLHRIHLTADLDSEVSRRLGAQFRQASSDSFPSQPWAHRPAEIRADLWIGNHLDRGGENPLAYACDLSLESRVELRCEFLSTWIPSDNADRPQLHRAARGGQCCLGKWLGFGPTRDEPRGGKGRGEGRCDIRCEIGNYKRCACRCD